MIFGAFPEIQITISAFSISKGDIILTIAPLLEAFINSYNMLRWYSLIIALLFESKSRSSFLTDLARLTKVSLASLWSVMT